MFPKSFNSIQLDPEGKKKSVNFVFVSKVVYTLQHLILYNVSSCRIKELCYMLV